MECREELVGWSPSVGDVHGEDGLERGGGRGGLREKKVGK